MTTRLRSREFNQDTSGAKKAAEQGPVYITDRGRPAHVLLTAGSVRLMFVVDTNIVSELRKVRCGKADPGVAAWAEQVASVELCISAITIHEPEHSVLLLQRSDPAQGALLRAWLDESVAAAFKNRVLPVEERIARRAASLHVPDPAPFRDALIAATALVHDMTVVTRDLKDFQRFEGLDVVSPWS